MAEMIKIDRDSKLIKLMAAQARNERVESDKAEEAAQIIAELSKDTSPQNRHEIAQLIAFTVDELQQHSLDFMNQIADVKNIGLGNTPMFRIPTSGIKAYIQATGATTARSYIADKQLSVPTFEISARPAINIVDLRLNRINMADLIRQANREIDNMKLLHVEKVLHDAISQYSSPFYGSGTGIVTATLDPQIEYFSGYGMVTLLGDRRAVSKLAPFTGMAVNATPTMQYSGNMLDQRNTNGFIGNYNGAAVVAMTNAYEAGKTTPILDADWIYILASDVNVDQRSLKVVNQGTVQAMESQNIDDMVYEVRLDQRFGAAFVVGDLPTIGAYCIN